MSQIPELTEKELRRYEIKAENQESGAKEIYELEMQAQYGFYHKALTNLLYAIVFFIITMILLVFDSLSTLKPQYNKIWIGEFPNWDKQHVFFTVIVIILDMLWMGFIVVALFHYITTKGPYKTKYQLLEDRVKLQDTYNMVQEPRLKF
tara:strand:- start:1616 stop:2062 length:447 start_codon:yes stop_codon:yes gene_type:complete